MEWVKKGLIFSRDTFDIPWYKKNSMVPVPLLIDDSCVRIFVTMCDEDNVGRIGYVDVNSHNPKEIISYSKEPCLDIGKDGAFDDSGVLPSSLLRIDDKLYMIYSAYQKQVKVPYSILSGIACSNDNGLTFSRVSEVPFLDRKDGESFIRSAVFCLKEDNGLYRFWYSSGNDWIDNGKKIVPKYHLRYFDSSELKDSAISSVPAIELKDDEYGLTVPNVFFEDGKFKMFYSIRTISKGYRLGYAESKDGIKWDRMDNKMIIGVSKDGFDSEMICFGNVLKKPNKTYLFYCGNGYGLGGVGYAELEEKR